nr:hypothetical protein [Tanacetum cinerariifolium]
MLQRERHYPNKEGQILKCLVPKLVRYKKPFSSPRSRGGAWFSNVPFKTLTESKKQQNWIVPLESGAIRTVLDTGSESTCNRETLQIQLSGSPWKPKLSEIMFIPAAQT